MAARSPLSPAERRYRQLEGKGALKLVKVGQQGGKAASAGTKTPAEK